MRVDNMSGDWGIHRKYGFQTAPAFRSRFRRLQGDNLYYGGLWDWLKGGAKKVVSIPGRVVAANLEPVELAVSKTLKDVGEGAGVTVQKVTTPLIPILIIAAIGGYMYLKARKVDVTNIMKAR